MSLIVADDSPPEVRLREMTEARKRDRGKGTIGDAEVLDGGRDDRPIGVLIGRNVAPRI